MMKKIRKINHSRKMQMSLFPFEMKIFISFQSKNIFGASSKLVHKRTRNAN